MVIALTSTKTFAINPAFLQEVKEANQGLWELVARLGELNAFAGGPDQLLNRLTHLLDDLRERLATQFTLEDTYGYIEIPNRAYEVVDELASRARGQHRLLVLELSELVECAEELQYRGVDETQLCELLGRVALFHRQLTSHEQIENDLILRLFNRN